MANKSRKLVLHMDVNNTVFVGDSKTKLTALEGVLNEYLTEIVWGKVDDSGNWIPVQDPISVKPLTPDSISYYKYSEEKFAKAGKPRSEFKYHARQFTFESIGKQFRHYVEKVKECLRCKSTTKIGLIEPLLLREGDCVYYRIVPSFFKLLTYLIESNRCFSIILRTFGGDGEIALQGINIFSNGLHPQFPFSNKAKTRARALEINLTPGEITSTEEGLCVKAPDKMEYKSPDNIYTLFSQSKGVQLFIDDYEWWKKQGFVSAGGKPLLVDPKDSTMHHILFDDNIRAWDPEDNIVNLLVKGDGDFKGCDPQYFDDICLVRSHLFESVLNDNYFIEKLQMCEVNYQKYLETLTAGVNT